MHALLAALLAFAPPSARQSDPYAPLRLYDGGWQITRQGGSKPDSLINRCALLGLYFACAQTVNGAPGGLIVFIPVKDDPGHYHTQTIMPEGRATGVDDLRIEGNQWTYSSRRNDNGKTTYYRTLNTFADRNHIHFEQADSTDNKQWTVRNSGDEVKATK